jgi:hypothetical protein
METKHTPGPWKLDGADRHERTGAVLGFYVAAPGGGRVGQTFSNCLADDKESLSNALLFAAAPALLEAATLACDLAMRMSAKADIPYCAEFGAIAQELDAAIAGVSGMTANT